MRYAIYHLPQGELGAWGSRWLGWDLRQGVAVESPEPAGLPHPRATLTAPPRRYGFHATMKAPMHLAEGTNPKDVQEALRDLAKNHAPFAMPMALQWDWGFVALRPIQQPAALMALEQALVQELDPFRAPLTPQDRARRHPDRLSPQARDYLDRWGYPHVLDLFNYHLTLSGPVSPSDGAAIAQVLSAPLGPLLAQPMPVHSIALVVEGADKHFTLIEEFPLG